MADFIKESESHVRGETPCYSPFWGDWCRHWEPNSNYVIPPKDLPSLPAFTSKDGTWVFCPSCGEFLMLGGKKVGQISCHHMGDHFGGSFFADVVGPMTYGAKHLKRVGDKWCGKSSFFNRSGPNTKEYRFDSPIEAKKLVENFFVKGCSMSDAIARELLRYLRLGEDYPFRCNFSKQIKDGWIIGKRGQIISPVPKDYFKPAG